MPYLTMYTGPRAPSNQAPGMSDITNVQDLFAKIDEYSAKLDETFGSVQRIDANVEEIKPYVPWLTGGLFLLGGALLTHAVIMSRRK